MNVIKYLLIVPIGLFVGLAPECNGGPHHGGFGGFGGANFCRPICRPSFNLNNGYSGGCYSYPTYSYPAVQQYIPAPPPAPMPAPVVVYQPPPTTVEVWKSRRGETIATFYTTYGR